MIFFDKGGVGMSERGVGQPALEERSHDINAVLDAAGADEVAIFEMSECGAFFSDFEATYPERVNPLFLKGNRPGYN